MHHFGISLYSCCVTDVHVEIHPCREEQVFAREEVVGRDASSVFPTETRKAEVDARAQAFKALFGDNRRFVTETEVRELVCRFFLVEQGCL